MGTNGENIIEISSVLSKVDPDLYTGSATLPEMPRYVATKKSPQAGRHRFFCWCTPIMKRKDSGQKATAESYFCFKILAKRKLCSLWALLVDRSILLLCIGGTGCAGQPTCTHDTEGLKEMEDEGDNGAVVTPTCMAVALTRTAKTIGRGEDERKWDCGSRTIN